MTHARKIGIAFLALSGAIGWSAAASGACTVKLIATLAVSTGRGMPIAKGEINGHEARFLVDSGAFYSSISAKVAHEAGLSIKPVPGSFEAYGLGGAMATGRAYVDGLKLDGPWIINGVNFIVAGDVPGLAGTIGQNMLGRRDVEYDLAHGVVRSTYADDCIGQSPAYWAASQPVMNLPIQAMEEVNRHTIATVLVNGVKLHAMFDTGASNSVISLKTAKKLRLPLDDDGEQDTRGTGGSGKPMQSHRTRADRVEIGGETLHGANLQVLDLGNIDVDMLIGIDFFRAHHIYVGNEMHRMFFTYGGGEVLGVTPEIPGPAAAVGK